MADTRAPHSGLEWRLVGPHRGGRVVAVAGHPTDLATFYFGACAGGVWKTTDGGAYWENISDGFFATSAVGALAVSPSDPNVLYAGMGETAIRGNVSHGDGVYKSTDGGQTWTNMGLADTHAIARVRIHPTNPDLVYVAALGHVWGPNAARGVYRSNDGGKNWEQILFRSEQAGAIDLSLDPRNPRILYATIWEAQRYPYKLNSGGPGSGIFKSTDGGDNWTEITRNPGLPAGMLGKIGIAASAAQSGRVYAIVEAEDGALFRSDDGGATWQRLSEQNDLRWRAWYYQHIYADPQDADVVWILNGNCWKSIDGGKSFSNIAVPHGDNHDLWIDPNNTQRMIEGNDGGAIVTYNGGLSWSTILNQPTAQLYHVTTDDQVPYRLYGSQQDNSAISVPSMSVTGAINMTEWIEPGGGESGHISVKPTDPNIVVGGGIGSGEGDGRLIRYNHRTGQHQNISAWPVETGMGDGAKDLRYRFQWTFPIQYSPHDPDTLYVTSNHVHRSTDEGMSWEVISPDLTRNDPATQEPSGGPITKDNTGAEVYGTIFAFVESPHQQGLFWAGSDDGLIHLSKDNGASWQNVTPSDLPSHALISIIEVSPHAAGTAYVAATCYKSDDFRPYLYKTSDYGQTWTKITTGIPENVFTRTIREDPSRKGLLYCGTETGLYVSLDDGESWEAWQLNLPVTPLHDLQVKGTDLIAATHGRSFWILDDLTPLHQLTDEIRQQDAHLFKPRDTTRIKVYEGYGSEMEGGVSYINAGPLTVAYRKVKLSDGTMGKKFLDAGHNPPEGVILSYLLKDVPNDDITLTVSDASGTEIRTFSSAEPEKIEGEDEQKEPRLTKDAGMNRFTWNMRLPDAVKIPGDKSAEGYLHGPVVTPGNYQVRLTVGGQTQTQSFAILKDPRISATHEDLQKQFALLVKIQDSVSDAHRAILKIRDVRDQVSGWEKRIEATKSTNNEAASLLESAKSLKETLTSIEDTLIQVKAGSPLQPPSRLNSKMAVLSAFVDNADFAPTKQCYEAFDYLAERVNAQLSKLQEVESGDLAKFNEKLRQVDVPPVTSTVSAG